MKPNPIVPDEIERQRMAMVRILSALDRPMPNELEASGLGIGILLMLERHIEEEPLVAVERLRETFGDGRLGNGERLGVASERAGGAAKHVARELIEQSPRQVPSSHRPAGYLQARPRPLCERVESGREPARQALRRQRTIAVEALRQTRNSEPRRPSQPGPSFEGSWNQIPSATIEEVC